MTAPQTVADVQHTPGPWAASRQKARRVTANGVVICNAVLRNTGSAKNGRKHGQKAEAEAEANARLIAAAPDLLAALSSILPSPLCGESWDLPDEEMVQITVTLGELRAARAALRAAATSARQETRHGE